MKLLVPFVVALVGFVFVGCSINVGSNQQATAPNQNAASQPASTANAAKTESPGTGTPTVADALKPAPANCASVKIPGLKFIAKQSFAFDYKPYEGSCFVTFASEEDMLDDKDVPRGSTFHVFKDGKQVFEFPDAFAGQPACWVEAVAFDDLNGDDQTDVVMAGKCLGAKDSYSANAVYINNGKTFITKEAANGLLGAFSTVKEIEAYATKNQRIFF